MTMSPDENINSVVNMMDALTSAPDKYIALQNLKSAVFSIHPSALNRVVSNISFNILFELLETEDVDQIEVCCSLLSRLLSALPPSEVMACHEMMAGLTHPNTNVYFLALDCIEAGVVDPGAALVLARRPDLLKTLIRGLSSDDLEISKRTKRLLIKFGQHQHGRESVLAGEASLELKRIQNSSSTNRYRVFECVVGIAKASQQALDFCAMSGFLDELLRDLDDNDVLAQLNCIELIGDLSAFQIGLLYLESIGAVAKMERMLRQTETDSMSTLLLPGVLKFFGNLMHLYPNQIMSRWSSVVSRVMTFVPQSDPALAPVAIDTLGLVGSKPQGKLALHSVGGTRMIDAVKHVGTLAYSSGTASELKIRAIECLEQLFRLPPDQSDDNLLNLTQSWFSASSSSPLADVMRLCQLPFLNIRSAAFSILASIAEQEWGQTALRDHPGFQELILNRETESEIVGWSAKYNVIKAMVQTPETTRRVFGDPYFIKLRAYLLDGVFYHPTETEVATMEM